MPIATNAHRRDDCRKQFLTRRLGRRSPPRPFCASPAPRRRTRASRSASSARRPARLPASARPTTTSSTGINKAFAGGHRQQRQAGRDRDHRQGQPVEPEPRGRSGVGTDPEGRGQPHAVACHARHHQPGGRSGRTERGALHHHQLPLAALFLRPRRRSRRGLRLDLPLLLGPRGHHRQLHSRIWDQSGVAKKVGGLFPNDADGNAWGDPKLGLPGPLAAAGFTLIDPGRYQPLNNDFSSQIAAFKDGGLRDRHRRDDPAGLRHLLEPGGAAGLQPQGRHHRQGAAVPLRRRGAGRPRRRPDHRNLVVAEPSLLVQPDRADLPRNWPTATRPPPASPGRSRSASTMRCSKWPSTW